MMPRVARVGWKPSWRIISSRFPPTQPFGWVTNPEDHEAVRELTSQTGSRLPEEAEDVSLIAPEDRISGPDGDVMMKTFTRPNPKEKGRFSEGSYGVLYVANDLSTAVKETVHHREGLMKETPPTELIMQVYLVDLDGDLHDLRGRKADYPLVYDNDDYAAAQRLAKTLHNEGSNGIVYDSTRRGDGECAAVFSPRLLSNARRDRFLCYVWNGKRITDVYEKRLLEL